MLHANSKKLNNQGFDICRNNLSFLGYNNDQLLITCSRSSRHKFFSDDYYVIGLDIILITFSRELDDCRFLNDP